MNFYMNCKLGLAGATVALTRQSMGFVAPVQNDWLGGGLKPLKNFENSIGRICPELSRDLRDVSSVIVQSSRSLSDINPRIPLSQCPEGIDKKRETIRKPYGHSLTGLKIRKAIKNGLYGALGFTTAVAVAQGIQPPLVQFEVKADPPSLFYNFKISPDQIQNLKSYIGLPADWSLLPVTCVEGKMPEYVMSLNVYEVSGITVGLRAEWSIYVDRGDGEPSFFVFETHVEKHSMDPENIITQPAKSFTHGIKNNIICTEYVGHNGESFSIRVPLKNADIKAPRECKSDRQWLAANDYIFWPGGVCDMAYFSSDVYNSPLLDYSTPDVEISHKASFTQFLKKDPPSILALSKPATFIISPWVNVDVADR